MSKFRSMSTTDTSFLISVVVPCFNEEECINESYNSLSGVLDIYNYEIVFVDDGSSDQTSVLLDDIINHNTRVKKISLSRNFGHQAAVSAGMDFSRGDIVVLIDADLQDPPEVIHKMVELWKDGFDVVYGKRESRVGESKFKLATASLFYKILNHLSDVYIPHDTGDFRLMSRRVVDVVKEMPERDRFIRGMISWVGFNQTQILYQRAERFAGVSKYPLRKMISFAADGILSFSIRPLRVSIWMGLIASFLSFLGIVYAIFTRLYTDIWVSGWTFTIVVILFIGGVQLIFLGVVGEYVGRIYREGKSRPIYVVKETDIRGNDNH